MEIWDICPTCSKVMDNDIDREHVLVLGKCSECYTTDLAQRVEQPVLNRKVTSSNLVVCV